MDSSNVQAVTKSVNLEIPPEKNKNLEIIFFLSVILSNAKNKIKT